MTCYHHFFINWVDFLQLQLGLGSFCVCKLTSRVQQIDAAIRSALPLPLSSGLMNRSWWRGTSGSWRSWAPPTAGRPRTCCRTSTKHRSSSRTRSRLFRFCTYAKRIRLWLLRRISVVDLVGKRLKTGLYFHKMEENDAEQTRTLMRQIQWKHFVVQIRFTEKSGKLWNLTKGFYNSLKNCDFPEFLLLTSSENCFHPSIRLSSFSSFQSFL